MKTIFIISPTRSGSTLLWKILKQHKEISSNLTESFILFPLLYGRADRQQTLKPIPKTVYQNRAQEFINTLPKGQDDFDQSFQKFVMELYKKANGKHTYCIDKSPGGYLFILEELLERFPQQKFIFLFRNPLAIAASMSRSFSDGNIPIIMDNEVLNKGYRTMLRIHAHGQYRDRIHAVNYENLVSNPDSVIKDIYEYLDLNCDPNDIDGWEENKIKGMGDFWGEENYHTFSKQPLDKYKTFYSTFFRQAWAKNFLKSMDSSHMKYAGYDPVKLLAAISETPCNWTLFLKDIKYGGEKKVMIFARRIGQYLIGFASSPFSIKGQIKRRITKYVSRAKLKKAFILFLVRLFKYHDKFCGIKPLSFIDLPGETVDYLNENKIYPDRGNYLQVFPYDFTVEAKNCSLSRYAFYSENKFRLCFGQEGDFYPQVQIRNFTANTLKFGFFLHNFFVTPTLFTKNFLLDRWKIIRKHSPDQTFNEAIIINCFWKAYGHFIHDAIPMIEQAIHNVPLKYPSYKNAPIIIMADPTYHLPILVELGYDPDRFVFLESHQRFHVKAALFHLIGSRESKDVSTILKKVKKNLKKTDIQSYKRIFIDRKDANGRILSKESRQKVFNLLDQYSIQPVILEDHPFEVQVALMDQADLIVGWHGSGMANMHLTSKKKTALIMYETMNMYKLQNPYDKILPAHVHQEHLILATRDVKEKRLEAKLNHLCSGDS